jgi:hypothetical protein
MKAYILLDRSGSMASQWTDTLGAVNMYVTKLKKNYDVHFATFCSDYKQVPTQTIWIPAVWHYR